jgi:crossover junction endodeoxyribonuclease RusA
MPSPSVNHEVFACEVVGTPAPQGSKRHVGKGVMVESSEAVASWRDSVAMQVRSEMNHDRHPGFGVHVPVEVSLLFRMQRPVTLPRRVQRHVRKPDLDKLVRATMDGLVVAGLLADDAQVWAMPRTYKVYRQPHEDTGCLIVVRQTD